MRLIMYSTFCSGDIQQILPSLLILIYIRCTTVILMSYIVVMSRLYVTTQVLAAPNIVELNSIVCVCALLADVC